MDNATPGHVAPVPSDRGALVLAWIRRHTTPYHIAVAAVLGGATVGFILLVAVLIIIATNFNVLGLIE